MGQRGFVFMNKLQHRYLLPKNIGSYNTTQIRNVVHCDQAVEILRFKDEGWIPWRGILWLCFIGAMAYVALFYGLFDWIPELF
jgi:hypothetical protein